MTEINFHVEILPRRKIEPAIPNNKFEYFLIMLNEGKLLGHTHFFDWGPYAAFHGMALTYHLRRFHDNRHMNTSGDVTKSKIVPLNVKR
jgi:hypothetical protein